MVKVIFDLDGTLYSFRDSNGLGKEYFDRIVRYTQNFLNIPEEEAIALSDGYYRQYGLTIRGLLLHHKNVDPQDYTHYVHDVDLEKMMVKHSETKATLQKLLSAGADMWVLTNSYKQHADRVLKHLDLHDLFVDPKTGDVKIVDCFDMWKHTEACIENKPAKSSYELMEQRCGVDKKTERIVMVEDAMVNLRAPDELGWVSVWIQDGRERPADLPAHFRVIDHITDIFPAVHDLF